VASTFNISNLAASTSCDAICGLLAGGKILIYDGAQPATCDTAITTQTKLAQVSFGSPAFTAASNGAALANAIAPGTGLANGDATWCRFVRSTGAVIADGSVGTSDCDLNVDTTTIQAGALVSVTSGTWVERKS
jgi:hypothetical protein